VAKGFTQREGIDYNETFSLVSCKDSFRIIIALVAHYYLELHQMDVKTMFLNGDLEENVYMAQLKGFVVKEKEPKCFLVEEKEHMGCVKVLYLVLVISDNAQVLILCLSCI
jgi:hypothetical protein